MSFVGGKLKLKGGVDLSAKSSGVSSKKKKKKSSSKTIEEDKQNHDEKIEEVVDRRTDAEKRHEAHMLKYEQERLKKTAGKSHRERIKEMNEKLATLTEHHDLPRISYSYM